MATASRKLQNNQSHCQLSLANRVSIFVEKIGQKTWLSLLILVSSSLIEPHF